MKNHETGQAGKGNKFFIYINDEKCEVSEAVYKEYYRMDRRERYLKERSTKRELSYDALNSMEYPIEEKMVFKARTVEEEAIKSVETEKVLEQIAKLPEEEKHLIYELFFNGKKEREVAKSLGISKTALHYRKVKILKRLK
ncbi:MAG: RNA polymerase sigma factor [Alkaliphilus sp.]